MQHCHNKLVGKTDLRATSSSSVTSMKGCEPEDHISHRRVPNAYTSDFCEYCRNWMDSGAIHLCKICGNHLLCTVDVCVYIYVTYSYSI